jgi:hypothetical protein
VPRLTYGTMSTLPSDTPYALVVDDDDFIIRADATDNPQTGWLPGIGRQPRRPSVRLLKARHPDITLLFTDVQKMPGDLDGFALARKVAASWPHISIVVASGLSDPAPARCRTKRGSLPSRSALSWFTLTCTRAYRTYKSLNPAASRILAYRYRRLVQGKLFRRDVLRTEIPHTLPDHGLVRLRLPGLGHPRPHPGCKLPARFETILPTDANNLSVETEPVVLL